MRVEKPVQKWSDSLRRKAWKKTCGHCQQLVHTASSTFILC